LEKIPGQLEASFLIFLSLGSIKQSNTHTGAENQKRTKAVLQDRFLGLKCLNRCSGFIIKKKKEER